MLSPLTPVRNRYSRPQHRHVEIFAYEDVDDTGNFQHSTRFVYIVSDIGMAEYQAQREAKPNQTKFHIREVVQCSDPQHLEGIPDE